jgi:Ca2+-binding EF-hand superfamily protein
MYKFLIAAAALTAATAGIALAQEGQGGGGGHFAQMIAAADTNHDGNITRAEFDAARTARFAQMDADHNGTLSASEMPQRPGGGGNGGMRGDANSDGSVTRAEFDAEGQRLFARLDADNNGTITQAELQAAQQHMQSMRR